MRLKFNHLYNTRNQNDNDQLKSATTFYCVSCFKL